MIRKAPIDALWVSTDRVRLPNDVQRLTAGRARRDLMQCCRGATAPPGADLLDKGLPPDLVAKALADVERWGVLRNTLIFNQRAMSVTPFVTYSSPELNEILGEPDILKVIVYLDGRSNVVTTTLALILEHSPDGITWTTHIPYLVGDEDFTGNTLYRRDNSANGLSSQLRRLSVQVYGSPGAEARVRIWATSRGRAKRRFHEQVLDEFIVGSTVFRTDERLAALLASSDALQLFAIADDVTGGLPTLTVQIEESPDGQNWKNKTGTPEIDALGLYEGAKIVGQDSGALPTSKFIRLRVQLGGTTPAAHIRLFATGRGA